MTHHWMPLERPMTPHIRHPRDERQSVCGIPAADVTRWETEDPPRAYYACEDCLTGLETRPGPTTTPTPSATPASSTRCARSWPDDASTP